MPPTPRTWRRKRCCGSGRTRRAGSRWRRSAPGSRAWWSISASTASGEARWVELEAAGEIVDPAPVAGESAELAERERLLAAAIAELPGRQRAAIVLTYSEGMSNAQVADILDTTVSAVETLLVRGKQNLRRALADVIDGE